MTGKFQKQETLGGYDGDLTGNISFKDKRLESSYKDQFRKNNRV